MLYAVHTELALGIVQRQCWEDRELLCEQDDGVCCYTGRYVGTECNSDSVGKTDSYCVSKMMGFVVIPAGM